MYKALYNSELENEITPQQWDSPAESSLQRAFSQKYLNGLEISDFGVNQGQNSRISFFIRLT